jgi:hypothetical protein
MEELFQKVNVVLTQYAGKSTKYKRFSFPLAVRILVGILHFLPFYVVNWEAVNFMPNDMDKFIYKTLMNTCLAFSLVAYLIASFRHPKMQL